MKIVALILLIAACTGCKHLDIEEIVRDQFPDEEQPQPEPEPEPEPTPDLPAVNDWTTKPHWSGARGAPDNLAAGVPYSVYWKGAKDFEEPGNWRFAYNPPGQPGMWKPESKTWFIPMKNPTTGGGMGADAIGKVAIMSGEDLSFKRWGRWPRGGTQSGQPIDGNHIAQADDPYYFGPTIKIRQLYPDSGDWLFAWDIYDQELYKFQVIDKDVIQE